MSIVNIGRGSSIEKYLEIQRKRCNDETYNSFPDPCLSCVLLTKNIEFSSCRFRNIRAFKRQPDTKRLIYGPYFVSNKHRSFHLSLPATMVLPTMSQEQRIYIQESIRSTMKELLERDWKVMKLNQQKLQRRPPSRNSRHTCDHCSTNIFNVHYMCTICGVELCLDCFELDLEWIIDSDDSDDSNDSNDSDDSDDDLDEHSAKFNLTSCTLGRRHTKSQFIPITKHTFSNIEKLRLHTSLHIPVCQLPPPPVPLSTTTQILDSNPSPTSSPSSQYSTRSSILSMSSLLSTETPIPTPQAFIDSPTQQQLPLSPTVSPPNELHPITFDMDDGNQLLVSSWKTLTLEDFQCYWRTGKPAMIQDTMERSKLPWTPDFFCKEYGNEMIDAIDCRTTKVKQMTINEFFKRYMEPGYQTPVFKIKDWPPGADFKAICPTLYDDFMATLPIPEYCTATGVFNLSNRLPDLYIKPDLGPKMFIAYGLDPTDTTTTTCEVGTTNLHCDMTDAVNVMCHAQNIDDNNSNNNNNKYDIGLSSSPGKAAAVWDIFAFDDLPYLRQFLMELLKEKAAQSPTANKKFTHLDPIHSQWIYLTDRHLKELKEKYNVIPWRLYQNPGDAIYIPAGCAHQVANRCNAIKCAYDFVSPENIDRSATITRQFGQAKQEDVLQLKTTLLYTWISVYKETTEAATKTTTKMTKKAKKIAVPSNHQQIATPPPPSLPFKATNNGDGSNGNVTNISGDDQQLTKKKRKLR